MSKNKVKPLRSWNGDKTYTRKAAAALPATVLKLISDYNDSSNANAAITKSFHTFAVDSSTLSAQQLALRKAATAALKDSSNGPSLGLTTVIAVALEILTQDIGPTGLCSGASAVVLDIQRAFPEFVQEKLIDDTIPKLQKQWTEEALPTPHEGAVMVGLANTLEALAHIPPAAKVIAEQHSGSILTFFGKWLANALPELASTTVRPQVNLVVHIIPTLIKAFTPPASVQVDVAQTMREVLKTTLLSRAGVRSAASTLVACLGQFPEAELSADRGYPIASQWTLICATLESYPDHWESMGENLLNGVTTALASLDATIRASAMDAAQSWVNAAVSQLSPNPPTAPVPILMRALPELSDVAVKAWDDSWAAISYAAQDLFKTLLDLSDIASVGSGLADPAARREWMKQTVAGLHGLPAQSKGKYGALKSIISSVGVDLVLETAPEGWMTWLAGHDVPNQGLVTATCTMFALIAKDLKGTAKWEPVILKSLILAMATGSRWISRTVDSFIPVGGSEALKDLLRLLPDYATGPELVTGRVVVWRAGRRAKLWEPGAEDLEAIQGALTSASPAIRMDAWDAILLPPKTSTLLNGVERTLVYRCWRSLVKPSSGQGRHRVAQTARRFAARIAASVNGDRSPEGYTDAVDELLEWLGGVSVSACYPGVPFSRVSTSLAVLSALLDEVPRTQKLPKWCALISAAYIPSALVAASATTWDEVREAAWGILKRLPDPISGMSMDEIHKAGLVSVASVQAREADQGGRMMALLWAPTVGTTEAAKALVALVSAHADEAERDFINAAGGAGPMHGPARALRYLLGGLSWNDEIRAGRGPEWRPILESIWAISDRCMTLCLSATGRGAATSIDDDKVGQWIGKGDQLAVVCCWLTLSEMAQLVGGLVQTLPLPGEEGALMTVEEIDRVGSRLVSLLLTLRHNGAIDLTHRSLTWAAARVAGSSDPAIGALLGKWLDMALAPLQGGQVSVSRRSGGLPYAVAALLRSERGGGRPMLAKTMDLALACSAMDGAAPDMQCQVHALNTLRYVFKEPSLSAVTSPWLGEALKVVLQVFEAQSWALRNAGLLLFHALMQRVGGPKSSSATMLGANVFRRTGSLYPWLRDRLGSLPVSALMPALVLLSLLSPADYEDATSVSAPLSGLRPGVERALSSPHEAVRIAAAGAYVSATPRSDGDAVLDELLTKLDRKTTSWNSNGVHGGLVAVKKLLERIGGSLSRTTKARAAALGAEWALDDVPPIASAGASIAGPKSARVVLSRVGWTRMGVIARVEAWQALEGELDEELLRAALKDPAYEVRAAALESIKDRKVAKAGQLLWETLADTLSRWDKGEAHEVLEAALGATREVQAVGDVKAVLEIVREIASHARVLKVRAEAVHTLGWLCGLEGTIADRWESIVLDAIREDQPDVLRAAGVASIADSGVLVKGSHDPVLQLRVWEMVLIASSDDDPDVRAGVAELVAEVTEVGQGLVETAVGERALRWVRAQFWDSQAPAVEALLWRQLTGRAWSKVVSGDDGEGEEGEEGLKRLFNVESPNQYAEPVVEAEDAAAHLKEAGVTTGLDVEDALSVLENAAVGHIWHSRAALALWVIGLHDPGHVARLRAINVSSMGHTIQELVAVVLGKASAGTWPLGLRDPQGLPRWASAEFTREYKKLD